jgi:hypothetical protein
MSEKLRIVATCPKCKSVFDVIKQSNKSSAKQERKLGAVEELELDISWLKDLEDYAYLFSHKGEMLNRITMRKEYQNKRLKDLKEGVE